MIIKRYIVDNMNEAMVRIRYELGSEAIIVSQRKIKQRGILGAFKKRKIEVTAAVDDRTKRIQESIEKKDQIEKEISELKGVVENLINQKNKTKNTPTRSKSKQKLVENDIPLEIVEDINNKINEGKKVSPKNLESEIRKAIKEILKTCDDNESKIQVLVGPTGVGKTTTIAKLAGLYSLYRNKKVGLITIDTYRIGAVEQLKTYADILGVPFEVAISIKDIPQVLKKMSGCDIIFIDTTGRNSKNIMQISETKKFVELFKADKIHLVLSMTTKQRDLKKIIQNYKILKFNSLILTKVDETEVYGSILTSAYYGKVPISYITTGQNVPEDIEEARNDKLVNLVLGAEN
jgi:flagellar biosynthesis protein FlhF